MSDWQAAQKQAYDDSLRAQSGEGFVSLPVSEFENLHEHIRVLQEKIAQLEAFVIQYRDGGADALAQVRAWKAVVAATHGGFGQHRNPYHQCPQALCVAARLGSGGSEG